MKPASRRMTSLPNTSEVARGRIFPNGIHRLLAALLLIVTVFAAVYPRLAPDVCFEDSGDLQLAAATLGIMHPPGYPIYASLAWPATLIHRSDPARAVTVFCLLMGCLTLSIGWLIQVRLGVNVWIAGAVMLAITDHQRVWNNLVAPEVYILSLLFLATSVYALIRYSQSGLRRYLIGCGLAIGVAMASRPPLIIALPFFIVAWWTSERRRRTSRRERLAAFGLTAAAACLPGMYALGYLYVRDVPSNPHNFIEDRRIEMSELPAATDGVAAKLQRVYWEASARLFQSYIGDRLAGVRQKARWTEREIFDSAALLGSDALPEQSVWEISLLLLTAVGMAKAFRISSSAGWAVLGPAVASLLYVLEYRVHGQAADLLPLVFISAVVLGIATIGLHMERWGRAGRILPVAVAIAAATWTLYDAPSRPNGAASRDATSFIRDIDVGTLPRDAVIVTTWGPNMPLKYATTILSPRPDILVVPAGPERWLPVIRQFPGRPIFLEGPHPLVERCHTTPYRSLLLLDPSSCPESNDR